MSKTYRAFLLRLTRQNDDSSWRVTLKDANRDEELHFASEREFARYILKTFSISPDIFTSKPTQPPNHSRNIDT